MKFELNNIAVGILIEFSLKRVTSLNLLYLRAIMVQKSVFMPSKIGSKTNLILQERNRASS